MRLCRSLGIRTVAGFMIGFPEDTEKSIRSVLRYAKAVNPTFANFNVVTPYPGTEFYEQIKSQIATFDTSKYTVYTPVLKYRYLTSQQVSELHAKCFLSYFFRGRWFWANGADGVAVAAEAGSEAAADARDGAARSRRPAEAAHRVCRSSMPATSRPTSGATSPKARLRS